MSRLQHIMISALCGIIVLLSALFFIQGTNQVRDRTAESETEESQTTSLVPIASAAAMFTSAKVTVTSFGAVGDGVTDDWKAITNAVAKAKELRDKGLKVTLVFPELKAFASSKPVKVPANVGINQKAPLIYTGSVNQPFFVIGEENATTTAQYSGLLVKRAKVTNWATDKDEKTIGILIYNANASHIDIQGAEYFTVGIQTMGIGTGFVYNDIRLGKIASNQIGLKVTNRSNVNGIKGWNNENLYLGGNFTVWTGVNSGQSRYGIVVTSEDGTYTNNNNNVFIKPSIELNRKDMKDPKKDCIPIVIEYGLNNSFDDIRNEGNGDYLARILNDSRDNRFTVGYGEAMLDNQSEFGNEIATTRTTEFFDQFLLTKSYPLAELSSKTDRTITIQGMSFLSDSGGITASTDQGCIKNESGYLVFGVGCVAAGVMIDTSSVKQFVVKRAAEGESGGRIVVVGFDKNGDRVNGKNMTWLRGTNMNTFYFSNNFGGVFMSARDHAMPLYFDLQPDIDHIWVGVAAGSKSAVINSLAIFNKSLDFPAIYRGVQ